VKILASWSCVGTWIKAIFPFLYVVSQKKVSHFYVLGFGMEHWFICNACDTCATTLNWDMGILLTKVTHGICDCQMVRSGQHTWVLILVV
jgi:hypothetical protein